MKLEKTIRQDNKIINVFNYFTTDEAHAELINLFINKLQKKYRANITPNPHNNTIKASLTFDSFGHKYRYEYIFTEIDNKIDLYF